MIDAGSLIAEQPRVRGKTRVQILSSELCILRRGAEAEAACRAHNPGGRWCKSNRSQPRTEC